MLRNIVLVSVFALPAFVPLAAQSFLPEKVEQEATLPTQPVAKGVEPVSQADNNPFETQGRRLRLGYGRLVTNDLFGDGKDRWRTGSISTSRVWGYDWNGAAPQQFGELLEFRLHSQIIQGESLRKPADDDRPWAGVLSFGLHTHAQYNQLDYAVGIDVNVIGPQTNLDNFQTWFHRLIDASEPSDEVLDAQIGNAIRPTLVAEAGRSFSLAQNTSVRPFAELRAGDETLVRFGADVTFGGFGLGELMVREVVSGQRYRAVRSPNTGLSLVVGGDIACVADSIHLPESRGYELTSHRDRLRAGVHWQGEGASAFYGLTYLGKEFEAQDEGQLVDSIRLQYEF